MMKKSDKTQGLVFILPKSKEFFGRVSKDFQRAGLTTEAPQPDQKKKIKVIEDKTQFQADKEIEDLKELKKHLSRLNKLHERLKSLLGELDHLVKEES